jgi:hypothetical protein
LRKAAAEKRAQLSADPFNRFYAQAATGGKTPFGRLGYSSRKYDRLSFGVSPLFAALRRLVMMMHVMFVNMNFMDKWRDHGCDVVRQLWSLKRLSSE